MLGLLIEIPDPYLPGKKPRLNLGLYHNPIDDDVNSGSIARPIQQQERILTDMNKIVPARDLETLVLNAGKTLRARFNEEAARHMIEGNVRARLEQDPDFRHETVSTVPDGTHPQYVGDEAELWQKPVSRVDYLTGSQGFVQSARETDADLLVMGWDAVCAADRSTFGRTVDAVLAQLPLPVYLCRIGQEISEITHIHFVIPWEIDHHQGFYEAIYNAKQLAAECEVGIAVYTYGEHAHRYRQLFDLVEIDIKAEFKLTSSWSDLQSEFALRLQSTDFVITLAVREGEISWDDELWAFPTHYADVAAQSYALFFLREDDRKHDDQFLRTN